MKEQKNKKMKVGVVVSSAMDKTVVVLVERTVQHPVFKKYVRKKRKFMAHDEKNECKQGDKVEIMECRPLSKHKCWCVKNILKKSELMSELSEEVLNVEVVADNQG